MTIYKRTLVLIVMYLIQVGGGGSTDQTSVERYNPNTKRWSRMAPMSTGRMCVGVGVLNGLLYAVNFEEENQFGKMNNIHVSFSLDRRKQ